MRDDLYNKALIGAMKCESVEEVKSKSFTELAVRGKMESENR